MVGLAWYESRSKMRTESTMLNPEKKVERSEWSDLTPEVQLSEVMWILEARSAASSYEFAVCQDASATRGDLQ